MALYDDGDDVENLIMVFGIIIWIWSLIVLIVYRSPIGFIIPHAVFLIDLIAFNRMQNSQLLHTSFMKIAFSSIISKYVVILVIFVACVTIFVSMIENDRRAD